MQSVAANVVMFLVLVPPAIASVAPVASGEMPVFVGLNVPWHNYGADIGAGQFDSVWFSSFFAQAAANSNNVARFWLHADGARGGLIYDDSGAVQGLSETFLTDLANLVDLAAKNSIVLQLCLWSFDMCKDETSSGRTHADLISDLDKTNSYLSNALTPMLKNLIGKKNVFIEVVNEPEWCIKDTPCNTADCVTVDQMQRFVAAIASTVHEYAFKVTVGSASLKWSSPTQPPAVAHWWSDAAMKAHVPASGCASPTLDLYNVHYYDWMFNTDWGYDPMMRNTSFWQLEDKMTVVAEMPASSSHYKVDQLLQLPASNGFSGTMFWAYNDPQFPVAPAVPAMAAFAKQMGQRATFGALCSWLFPSDQPAHVGC